jgi:predicted alpha/beta superfamily hydrolase
MLAVASVAFVAPSAAFAQTSSTTAALGTYDVLSVISTELNETRPVWVRAPEACRAGAATTCDVLLVLDADALFPLAVAYAHVMEGMGRMAPLIIVGVPSLSMAERYRNFTTSVSAEDKVRFPATEGGPKFLRFLEREALPAVEREYHPSGRRTLAGHSLAGLFAIDAMTAGASFESYVALSPSIGINRQSAVERLVPLLERSSGTAKRLYVSVANDGDAYVNAFTRLHEEINSRKPAWLSTSFQRFRAEDHVTTIAPALNAAMNWLYVQRPPQ